MKKDFETEPAINSVLAPRVSHCQMRVGVTFLHFALIDKLQIQSMQNFALNAKRRDNLLLVIMETMQSPNGHDFCVKDARRGHYR